MRWCGVGGVGWGGVGLEYTSVGGGHGGEAWGQALIVVLQLLPKKTCASASTGGHCLPVILELHHPTPGEQPSKPTHTHTHKHTLSDKQYDQHATMCYKTTRNRLMTLNSASYTSLYAIIVTFPPR